MLSMLNKGVRFLLILQLSSLGVLGQDVNICNWKTEILEDCLRFIDSQYSLRMDSCIFYARLDLYSRKPKIVLGALVFEEDKRDSCVIPKLLSSKKFKHSSYTRMEEMGVKNSFSRTTIFNKDYFLNSLEKRNRFSSTKLYIEFHRPINGWESLTTFSLVSTSNDNRYQHLLEDNSKIFIPVFFWEKSGSYEQKRLIMLTYKLLYTQNKFSFQRQGFLELN